MLFHIVGVVDTAFVLAGSFNVLLVISDRGWQRFNGSGNVGLSHIRLLMSVARSGFI